MPIYTMKCAKCGWVGEQILPLRERNKPQKHDDCGGKLTRDSEVELPTLGKPSFQGGVILGNGKKVPGHFGKAARMKKGWHRP